MCIPICGSWPRLLFPERAETNKATCKIGGKKMDPAPTALLARTTQRDRPKNNVSFSTPLQWNRQTEPILMSSQNLLLRLLRRSAYSLSKTFRKDNPAQKPMRALNCLSKTNPGAVYETSDSQTRCGVCGFMITGFLGQASHPEYEIHKMGSATNGLQQTKLNGRQCILQNYRAPCCRPHLRNLGGDSDGLPARGC